MRDHRNYSIVDIGKNTEKSPRYMRRLGVIHPVESHQLTLLGKNFKGLIGWLIGWLVGFYGISTFLTPIPCL